MPGIAYHRAVRWLPWVLPFLLSCKVKEAPPIKEPYADSFERADIGGAYVITGEGYAIVNGALSAKGAKNHPLWLARRLPRDAKIEFDCWSTDRRGDIKIEVFGDGRSYDPDGGAYLATGYELIFGGWSNSKSIIARLDEHGNDVVQRGDIRVVANQRYHWKIERKGRVLKWFIDDMKTPFLQFEDKDPLDGPGHEFLGFNNWETDTWFDNLVITPL
jgi:hypothetical protein